VPKDLAALLVEGGAVSAPDLERARTRQRDEGGTLDTALLELGLVDEARVVEAMALACELPGARPEAYAAPDPRARRVFPSKVAERHGLAPVALDGRDLHVVATCPADPALLDEISFMLSLHLSASVGPEFRVRELIHRLYGSPLHSRLEALHAALAGSPAPAQAAQAGAHAPADGAPGAEAPAAGGESPGSGADDDGFTLDVTVEPLAEALAQAVEDEPDTAPPLSGEPPPAGEQDAQAAAEALPAPAADGTQGAPPDRTAPPRWTFDAARAALAGARGRDGVVLAALRYARDFFDHAAMFAVTRDAVAGHDALGREEDARDRCRATALYASEPGFLRTVIDTRSPYLGPVSRDAPGTVAVLDGLGRGTPRAVLVFPVLLRDRPVCILYADNGDAPVSPRRLGDLLLFLSGLGGAFERIVRERKSTRTNLSVNVPGRTPRSERVSPSAPIPEPDRATHELPPAPPEEPLPVAPEHVAPPADAAPAAEATAPSPLDPDAEVDALAATAPGTPERAERLARVVALGEAAVGALCERLPGPLDAPPESLEAAAPEAQGPLLAALAAIGARAARQLSGVLLSDPDPARRRAAAAALARAADATVYGALADRVFDPDPSVARAVVAALAAHRRDPKMRDVPERLRRALLSGVSNRPAAAARALGALRDVGSVPGLIQVLETGDAATARASADALCLVTLQRLGTSARSWLSWWKENRGRGRAEWLFSALTHGDREVRAAAAAELGEAGAAPVEYSPDLPAAARQKAARDWASWFARSGHVL
jgi:hypothetical protein